MTHDVITFRICEHTEESSQGSVGNCRNFISIYVDATVVWDDELNLAAVCSPFLWRWTTCPVPRVENKDWITVFNMMVVLFSKVTNFADDVIAGGLGVTQVGDLRARDIQLLDKVIRDCICVRASTVKVVYFRRLVIVDAND